MVKLNSYMQQQRKMFHVKIDWVSKRYFFIYNSQHNFVLVAFEKKEVRVILCIISFILYITLIIYLYYVNHARERNRFVHIRKKINTETLFHFKSNEIILSISCLFYKSFVHGSVEFHANQSIVLTDKYNLCINVKNMQ